MPIMAGELFLRLFDYMSTKYSKKPILFFWVCVLAWKLVVREPKEWVVRGFV